MSAEIIPVEVCLVCGRWRVERNGQRSIKEPKDGARCPVQFCAPCKHFMRISYASDMNLSEEIAFDDLEADDPDPGPGAA